MDIVYQMPHQHQRLFINVIHACPNACLFCVDFKGDTFYGFDLKGSRAATTIDIVTAIAQYQFKDQIMELYYCGIGEPLLLYARVVESVAQVRELLAPEAMVAINTSGTYYYRNPRVDFASHFDLIQVSLNAENEDKYDQICRPKVKGMFGVVMSFLSALREYIDRTDAPCRVELTVVDTTEREYLPECEREVPCIPAPDVEACSRIAGSFGWPLKVKKLIRDCEQPGWSSHTSIMQDALDR